jgi:hypothetical protein
MHYAPNVPQPRRALAVPLMAAAVLGAGVATATFALVNIEDEPIVSLPTPATEPAAIPSDAVAGQRNDGGPEEGTALQSVRPQTAPSSASSAAAAGTRYDGGPEEGTRGVVGSAGAGTAAAVGIPSPAAAAKMNGEAGSGTASTAAAGTRYDGGPEEGTRGIVVEEQSAAGSSGPTPFSGARP